MAYKIIFHHPLNLNRLADSGSSVRPQKMLQAFKDIGVDVIEVTGNSDERKKKFQKILADGENILGLYAENSTMPIDLCDPDHLPRNMGMDAKYFNELRQRNVVVTSFYRDIHWKFPEILKKEALWKRLVKIPFHYREISRLQRSVDILYFPTLEMAKELGLDANNSCEFDLLPPGCDESNEFSKEILSNQLNLLYVGGIEKPLYDLSALLEIDLGSDQLLFCCRKKEWARTSYLYPLKQNASFQLFHVSGAELENLFKQSNILLYLLKPSHYLELTFSVKIFETLPHGVPIICFKGTAAAEFVEKNGIGWAIESSIEVSSILKSIHENPKILQDASQKCIQIGSDHTWKARARKIIKDMERRRKG